VKRIFSLFFFIATSGILWIAVPASAQGEEPSYDSVLKAIQLDAADAKANCALLFQKKETAPIQSEVESLDIRDFTIRTTLYGQEQSVRIPVGSFEAGIKSHQVDAVMQESSSTTLWSASLIPFEAYRRWAFDHLSESVRRFDNLGARTIDDYETFLKTPFKASETFNEKAYHEFFTGLKASRKSIKPESPILLALCATYGVIDSIACAKALGTILDSMAPSESSLTDMRLLEETEEFYRNERHLEPLRKTASKMIADVKSESVPNTTLFEDLNAAYLDSGFSPKEAYEAVWQFLGISATAGPNTYVRLGSIPHQETNRRYFSMLFAAINMGASVLDARTLAGAGHFYSLPRNVVSQVENSKPYHFWMSAYFARKAAIQFGNEGAAANAAWLANVGYQVRSSTVGRSPTRAFTVAAFGPENNKIRLDLAYSSTGAVFGSRSAEKLAAQNYDVNLALKNLLVAGEALPPMKKEDAEELFTGTGISAWRRWKRIFGPDQAIRTARTSK
jgi:hypothetical protein